MMFIIHRDKTDAAQTGGFGERWWNLAEDCQLHFHLNNLVIDFSNLKYS